MIPYYNKSKLNFSKKKRKDETYAEMKLWSELKGKKLLGYKFRRQYVIDKYIVDFYCIELKLIIEVDGASHDEEKYEYDKKRENELRRLGNTVLRFTEYEVRSDIDNVLETIVYLIEKFEQSTSPNPSC